MSDNTPTGTGSPAAAPGTGLLADKAVLVTGAGRGIGAAAARLFAREGAKVVLSARTESELAAVTDEVRAAGGTADYVIADLADPESVRAAVRRVVDLHGRLDGAFNNAAAAVPPVHLADLPERHFDWITRIDLKGSWVAMAAEVAAIRETAGSGAIVNNTSIGSFRGNPTLGAYGAVKRAVNSLTQTAAIEYGPDGIRVNAIAPGVNVTAMMQQWETSKPGVIAELTARIPLGRPADLTETAEAAAWLLSDRSSYVTGAILPVDGGMSA